jgi:hypothetical protein
VLPACANRTRASVDLVFVFVFVLLDVASLLSALCSLLETVFFCCGGQGEFDLAFFEFVFERLIPRGKTVANLLLD